MQPTGLVAEAVRAAGPSLKWVSTIYAGLDAFPLDFLRARGIVVTNGVGINAVAVAEYAVMGVLAAAKRFDDVVRAQDRREWLSDSPGKVELAGTAALVQAGIWDRSESAMQAVRLYVAARGRTPGTYGIRLA